MHSLDRLTLGEHRAQLVPGVVGADDLGALVRIADGLHGRAGQRMFGHALVRQLCGPEGPIGVLADRTLPGAWPVRAVLFDKTSANNWAVAWRQDRTIAVHRRIDVDGFGPWSVKAGLPHVEPPSAILSEMITLRVHLDDCGADNAPLLVALGSHRLGRVAAGEAARQAFAMRIAACIAEAGDVWLNATPILHASDDAVRPGRRRVLQVDFAASDLPDGLEWAGI